MDIDGHRQTDRQTGQMQVWKTVKKKNVPSFSGHVMNRPAFVNTQLNREREN